MNRYVDRWMDPHTRLAAVENAAAAFSTAANQRHGSALNTFTHMYIYIHMYMCIQIKHFPNVSSLKNLIYTSTILLTSDFFDPQQPTYTVAPSHV